MSAIEVLDTSCATCGSFDRCACSDYSCQGCGKDPCTAMLLVVRPHQEPDAYCAECAPVEREALKSMPRTYARLRAETYCLRDYETYFWRLEENS